MVVDCGVEVECFSGTCGEGGSAVEKKLGCVRTEGSRNTISNWSQYSLAKILSPLEHDADGPMGEDDKIIVAGAIKVLQ